MNILLKNIPNTYNYGSQMMAENLITYLNKRCKFSIHYYTEANTEADLTRLREATGYEQIDKDKMLQMHVFTEKIKYVRFIERQMKRNQALKRACQFYDAIIVLGGDDFSEIYYQIPRDNPALKNALTELTFYHKNTKLFMIGQTIGPYTGERLEWAKQTFQPIEIYSRDDVTATYMKEVMGKEIHVSRDLALLPLHLEDTYIQKKAEILKQYQLVEEEYIVFVGTGLINRYTKNTEQFLEQIHELIIRLQEKYPSKKIVWLNHVLKMGSDMILCDKMEAKYPHFMEEHCVCIKEPVLPIEARIILGGSYFTISCRMHAAVSTFEMGKPAICLSYSPKYKGVIGDGLKRSDLVLESKDEFWNHAVSIILEKVDYIETNYNTLKKEIPPVVEECRVMINQMLDTIAQQIEG